MKFQISFFCVPLLSRQLLKRAVHSWKIAFHASVSVYGELWILWIALRIRVDRNERDFEVGISDRSWEVSSSDSLSLSISIPFPSSSPFSVFVTSSDMLSLDAVSSVFIFASLVSIFALLFVDVKIDILDC